METPIRIGIIGDHNPEFRSHVATDEAIAHAAAYLSVPVETQWLATPSLEDPDAEKTLQACDGLWASPGSPYRSMDGALLAIRYARERNWPFFAT